MSTMDSRKALFEKNGANQHDNTRRIAHMWIVFLIIFLLALLAWLSGWASGLMKLEFGGAALHGFACRTMALRVPVDEDAFSFERSLLTITKF